MLGYAVTCDVKVDRVGHDALVMLRGARAMVNTYVTFSGFGHGICWRQYGNLLFVQMQMVQGNQ